MNKNISFSKLKVMIKSKGMTLKEVAEKIGESPAGISSICCDKRQPTTDKIAKLCYVLKCYPSEIISFFGYEMNNKYFGAKKPIALPNEAVGDVTYKPLWALLADYLYNISGKTANDLFDQIDPPRRINGAKMPSSENIKKATEVRFGKDYKAKYTVHTDYSKGLPSITRTKLRNDRSLNISVIYEICKKLGCSIDWVMSYK